MFVFLLVLCACVHWCASLTEYSPHPAVTKLIKLNPHYSPSVKVYWYFPEYGFGDYADTTHIYTCQHTGEPRNFIYGYSLALIVKPEFAKIHFSADINNVPEGHACVQVCAAFNDSLEKCSEPFKFDNFNTTNAQPRSYPVFWDQNKLFKAYPYILRIAAVNSDTSVEWYFPKYQTYIYTSTILYTCRFNPEDLSVYDLRYVTAFKTEHKNLHRAQLSQLPERWVCVRVCVASDYQVCGEIAKFDNQLIHDTPVPTTNTPSSSVTSPQEKPVREDIEKTKGVDNYDLVFDDYEELEGLLEESDAKMTSLKKDVFIGGNNSTTSNAYSHPPIGLFFSCLFICVMYLLSQ